MPSIRVRIVLLVAALAAAHAAFSWWQARRAETVLDSAGVSFSVVVRTARNLSADAHEAEALATRLARAGVDHAILQFKQDETDEYEGGLAFYPSSIAPVAVGYAADPLRALIDACSHRGIRVSGWLPTLHDPAAVRAHPGWGAAMLADEGSLVEAQLDWLCPLADDAIAYESSLLAEVARLYPELDSIYIDFIRYDGDRSCACPRCLDAWGSDVAQLERASHDRVGGSAWRRWVDVRADAITSVVERMRAALDGVRDGVWLGAFVLPFSAVDYDDDTQTGQDYARLADAGVDELVVLGYWDDWEKSPRWMRDRLVGARDQIDDACELAIALDADQSVLRTRFTLAELDGCDEHVTWFLYDAWTEERCTALTRAIAGHERDGAFVSPAGFDLAIRIDTEPDSERSYAAVRPEMIETLLRLFDARRVHATFVTCGRLLEREPAPILEAHALGHEIAVHAYDHEQLDDLTDDEQRVILDRALGAFHAAGLSPRGFAAPRNGITAFARDRLLDLGFTWDGSESFDPRVTLADPWEYTGSNGRTLLVLPFAVPNDWDARRVEGIDADAMLARWLGALAAARSSPSPFFVLDIHQWLVTEPANFAALEAFLDAAQAMPGVRFVTLSEMADHARARLRAAELDGSADS